MVKACMQRRLAAILTADVAGRALVSAVAERGIALLLGRSVKALEPGRKIAVLDNGTALP